MKNLSSVVLDHATANVVLVFTSHMLVTTLIKAGWLYPFRRALDRTYQAAYKRVFRENTFDSPSACYLCCSAWICQGVFLMAHGVRWESVVLGLSVAGLLDLIRTRESP